MDSKWPLFGVFLVEKPKVNSITYKSCLGKNEVVDIGDSFKSGRDFEFLSKLGRKAYLKTVKNIVFEIRVFSDLRDLLRPID